MVVLSLDPVKAILGINIPLLILLTSKIEEPSAVAPLALILKLCAARSIRVNTRVRNKRENFIITGSLLGTDKKYAGTRDIDKNLVASG